MRKKILISIVVAVVMLIVLLLSWPERAGGFHRATIILPNQNELIVEVADTEMEKELGLSNRADLGQLDGMLFLYDTADYHAMWMQDMEFELDVIWLNDSQIVQIDPVVPLQENGQIGTRSSQTEINMFLELESGQVEQLGLKLGDKLDIILNE